jgi:adenylate kinase family enzyme
MSIGLPPDKLATLRSAGRVHIIGGSGAGKTTLARQIGIGLSLPVHHLDELVLWNDGNGLRPEADVEAVLARILATPRWVTEGIYIEASQPLLESADTIIWLDHVSSAAATRRVLRRFVQGAVSEARGRRGVARFARLRDYSRHTRELWRAVLEMRLYHAAESTGTGTKRAPSRAGTEDILRPYAEKTLRCRAPADVAQLVAALK